MKTINIFAVVMLSFLAYAGCTKEKDPVPSTAPEDIYGDLTLPQGNHPYDDFIVDFYNRTGTMLLYKYVEHDIYWRVVGKIPHFTDWEATPGGGYYDVPADEDYVGMQLDLLQEKFFKYFSESFLKEMLPRKIFLMESFNYIAKINGIIYPSKYDYWNGTDHMIFGWGGERILSITPEEKKAFGIEAIKTLLSRVAGQMELPQEFFSYTNYSNRWPAEADRAPNGVLPEYGGYLSEEADWNSYVSKAMSTPYDIMTAPGGCLHPDVDVNGLIMKKYNVVIAHFLTEYDIDLQAIGDDTE